MSDITERLRAMATKQDHERGCEGRQYSCTCGHDARVDATIAEAADEIERLRAALRELIDQCVSVEKELTEEYYGTAFCGESLPLVNARAALGDQS